MTPELFTKLATAAGYSTSEIAAALKLLSENVCRVSSITRDAIKLAHGALIGRDALRQ